MRSKIWITLIALLLVVGVIFLVIPAPPDAVNKVSPVKGGSLIIGVTNDIDTFNPLYAETALAYELTHLMLFGLADLDENSEFTPELASSWQISEDHKKLTYYLRPDAVWSDGVPVTAYDVEFTYDLLKQPEAASPRSETLEYIKKVVVEDSLTVSFHFEQAYPGYMFDTAGEILPKHLLQDVAVSDLKTHPFSHHPISSGPFLLEKWVPQQYIEFVPNPGYFGQKAYLDRVIFKIVPDKTSLLMQLESGEIDMMTDVPPESVQRLTSKNSNINIYPVSGRVYYYLGYNLKTDMFSDADVRRALTTAIDRQGIISALLYGFGTACNGHLPAGLSWTAVDESEILHYDPDKAKTALAVLGWRDTDGDSWLDKNDERFEFDMLTGTGNQLRADVAVFIQQQLKQVGIKMNIVSVERSALIRQLRSGDFAAYLGGWSTSMQIDLTPVFHSTATKLFNFNGYSNPDVDRLIEQGREMLDAEKARPVWAEAQNRIYADQPYTFLFWKDRVVATHKRYQNVTPIALSVVYGLENWYQAEQDQ